MTLNTSQASLLAVQKGIGLGWSSILGLADGSVRGIVPVRIRGVRFLRDLYMVHARRPLPPVATAFVAWVLRSRPVADS